MGLSILVAAAALAVSPQQFLAARQSLEGSFAESGGRAGPTLTAWAALGLRAAGEPTGAAHAYLVGHEGELRAATDVALGVLAESAIGQTSEGLLARLEALRRADGRFGPGINSTTWSVLALAQVGKRVPRTSIRYLLARQSRSGGWGWTRGVAPDSNDTAATVQALRAARVGGRPIKRALAYLKRLQNRDGGFELTRGRGSDAQSTGWAIQAYLAAGAKPGNRAYRYLARLHQADGSYRYNTRHAVTPVWVTAQVLPALAGHPFPLR